MKSPITTHILDTAKGCPAESIKVTLEKLNESEQWESLGTGTSDADGRVNDLLDTLDQFHLGTYRLNFAVGPYFKNIESIYTDIPITFTVKDINQHYHIPLLLSPFGYSTYRGS